MSALPRLLDDPSVSETLRADLRRAQLHAVAPFDTAAGLERLRAGMKSGGGPVAPPGGGALPGSSWKVFAALGVVGAVGWLLLSGSPDRAMSPRSVPARIAAVEDKAAFEAPTVAIEVPNHSGEKREQVAPPASSSVVRDSIHKAAASEVVVPDRAADPLAEEIAHLGALRQLHHTDPIAAALFAREGHQKFPDGVLYEEREALLILSLKKAGRSGEAERRSADFQTRFPRSSFLSKMQQVVPTSKEPLPERQ